MVGARGDGKQGENKAESRRGAVGSERAEKKMVRRSCSARSALAKHDKARVAMKSRSVEIGSGTSGWRKR